jgi:glutamine amidotransferase
MIVVIDCGVGNIGSILSMGRKTGADFTASRDPIVVARADKLILPGVGAFDSGMNKLRESGLIPILNERVLVDQVPILGICLGLQFFTRGTEEGRLPGLNWIAAQTRRFKFPPEQSRLKVPHMGWNSVEVAKMDTLVSDLPPEPRFYFVHSYYVECDEPTDVLTWTTYGRPFASGVQRGNIRGTQFHPEKSHKFGLALLKNFIRFA